MFMFTQGVTVRSEKNNLYVARILGGGVIDRQGLLNVGDVIREVNGVEVYTPEQLAEAIKTSSDTINMKVEANFLDNGGGPQVMGGSESVHAVVSSCLRTVVVFFFFMMICKVL
jgi:S1-C subfamily serine protease